jgi:alpha-tubulin suppressor-like RCC1 family protein
LRETRIYRRSLDQPRCASPDLGRTLQVRLRSQSPHKRLIPQSALNAHWVCVGIVAFIASFLLTLHHSYAQGLIATSISHTCALTKSSDAGVRCWGNNSSGQLGDGTITNRNEPVAVVGLSSGVSAVGAGPDFSCALLTSGQVRCWGANFHGQLGTGPDRDHSLVPVTVLSSGGGPLTNVTSLSVGSLHVCAVLSSGGAKCWGANTFGQLGDNTTSSRDFPADVWGFAADVSSIEAGSAHSCLTTIQPAGGNVYCFGNNSHYQLGDGTTDPSWIPKQVMGLVNVEEANAGDRHSCARTIAGLLYCWGDNSEGMLGDGTTLTAVGPTTIIDGLSATIGRISLGRRHSCGRLSPAGGSNEIFCWGRGLEGQVGDGDSTQRNLPTAVMPRVAGAQDISSQGDHSCAWMAECSVKCWGSNLLGQIGDGTTVNAPSPVDISICSVEPTPTPTHTPTPTPTNTTPPESSPVVSPTAIPAPGEFTPIPVAPNTRGLPAPNVSVSETSVTVTAPVLTRSPAAPRGTSLLGYRFTIVSRNASTASVDVLSLEDSPFEALSKTSSKKRQIITKRNQITLRKLGKGTYRVTYQAVFKQKSNKATKTIFGKMSAPALFTVR